MKDIVLLGSTGSIGVQTLEVASMHKIKVRALTANRNTALLEKQAREFMPEYVAVADENAYADIKTRLGDTAVKILAGADGVCEAASLKTEMTVNAIVGTAGLKPTVCAINAGNGLGLANKETLVAGGKIVTALANDKNVQIIPIDSEHSAIFQSLAGNAGNRISKIILTASGGPFYGYSAGQLRAVTKEQALHHPNWSMGAKITVDSATMMNKGLELIEAVWLFGVKPEQVEITVHRQSVLHSAVEFEDGSVIGQLGAPDMRIPIQYALTQPMRFESPARRLSLFDVGTLTFEKPDEETFRCIGLAREAIAKGGNLPCVMNKANEIAVSRFLNGKIGFSKIWEQIESAMRNVPFREIGTVEEIVEAERETAEFLGK